MKYILFWSTFNPSEDYSLKIWENKELKFSPFHKLTLQSHIKHNNEVYLYTYQYKNAKVPKGIIVKDANDVFPIEVMYTALHRGHSIAIVSDAVRLKVASEVNGIVLDMDAVVLKPFPKTYGNFFSSMPAKMTGGFAPKWGKAHPPLTIHDNSWDGKALSCFPLKVGPSIKNDIYKLSNHIFFVLKQEPKKGSKAWNFILWSVKKLINKDKSATVYQPIYNCPVPSWLMKGKCYTLEYPTRLDGKTQLFGYTLPKAETILEKSYIVQHFFESAFSKSSMSEDNFWHTINENCFLAKEAEHILGNNWKKKLNGQP